MCLELAERMVLLHAAPTTSRVVEHAQAGDLTMLSKKMGTKSSFAAKSPLTDHAGMRFLILTAKRCRRRGIK